MLVMYLEKRLLNSQVFLNISNVNKNSFVAVLPADDSNTIS